MSEEDSKKRGDSNVAMIDRIYEILDGIDEDLAMLKRDFERNAKADVFAASSIFDAVEILDKWGYGPRLGLSSADADKFGRIKGQVGCCRFG